MSRVFQTWRCLKTDLDVYFVNFCKRRRQCFVPGRSRKHVPIIIDYDPRKWCDHFELRDR